MRKGLSRLGTYTTSNAVKTSEADVEPSSSNFISLTERNPTAQMPIAT